MENLIGETLDERRADIAKCTGDKSEDHWLRTWVQAYLGETVGWGPTHDNKASVMIKQGMTVSQNLKGIIKEL